MNIVLVAGGDDEIVEMIGTEILGTADTTVTDSEDAPGVIQVAGGEVGMDVRRDNSLF